MKPFRVRKTVLTPGEMETSDLSPNASSGSGKELKSDPTKDISTINPSSLSSSDLTTSIDPNSGNHLVNSSSNHQTPSHTEPFFSNTTPECSSNVPTTSSIVTTPTNTTPKCGATSSIVTTPTNSMSMPAIIPLVTPINITRCLNHTNNVLNSIISRCTLTDPYFSLYSFKRSLYTCPSLVQRLRLERQLKEHEGCVNCINFSWDGRLLASSSDDLQVVLWDWGKGSVVGKFESGHVANVFQAKFMPYCDDSVLVTAARDGQIICDVITSTGELHHSKRVGRHSDSAHKLSIEPGSPHVFLSCGEDGSVLQVDLREDNTRNKILVCKNEKNRRISLYSIFIDPSNLNYFAVSGRDQWARVYDRRLLREDLNGQHEPVKKFCPHHLMRPDNEFKRAYITCLVYSHDGKQLLCSYNDEDIFLFDASHSSEADHIHKYSGHRNSATVKGVNFFGLESEYVVSGSDCGNVFLWDTNTEKIVQYMEGDYKGVVNCLEPHPHIPVLATSGLDHDVKIFSPTADHLTTLDGLSEVTEKNKLNRKESWDTPSPSGTYEIFLEFIMRQYRRGLRERVGLEDEESDDSFMEDDEDD